MKYVCLVLNFSDAFSGIFHCWDMGHPKQRNPKLDWLDFH